MSLEQQDLNKAVNFVCHPPFYNIVDVTLHSLDDVLLPAA